MFLSKLFNLFFQVEGQEGAVDCNETELTKTRGKDQAPCRSKFVNLFSHYLFSYLFLFSHLFSESQRSVTDCW